MNPSCIPHSTPTGLKVGSESLVHPSASTHLTLPLILADPKVPLLVYLTHNGTDYRALLYYTYWCLKVGSESLIQPSSNPH